MKRSGLADSPFFTLHPEQEVRPSSSTAHRSPIDHIHSLYGPSNAQTHERTNEQMNERTDAQTHIRSDERTHDRSNVQPNERTNNQQPVKAIDEKEERPVKRYSYDIYVDQAEAIEAQCLKWKKERGKHIGKGEALRELLDKALPTKK